MSTSQRIRTVHPEGHEPLLTDWQRGEWEKHPNWTDELFWRSPTQQQQAEKQYQQGAYRRRKNTKEKTAQ